MTGLILELYIYLLEKFSHIKTSYLICHSHLMTMDLLSKPNDWFLYEIQLGNNDSAFKIFKGIQ